MISNVWGVDHHEVLRARPSAGVRRSPAPTSAEPDPSLIRRSGRLRTCAPEIPPPLPSGPPTVAAVPGTRRPPIGFRCALCGVTPSARARAQSSPFPCNSRGEFARARHGNSTDSARDSTDLAPTCPSPGIWGCLGRTSASSSDLFAVPVTKTTRRVHLPCAEFSRTTRGDLVIQQESRLQVADNAGQGDLVHPACSADRRGATPASTYLIVATVRTRSRSGIKRGDVVRPSCAHRQGVAGRTAATSSSMRTRR